MNEGLEALKEIEMLHCHGCFHFPKANCPCKVIEKELKALKFLVKKLGIRVSKSNSILDRKNTCYLYAKDNAYVISIKNYDLLKEVLL